MHCCTKILLLCVLLLYTTHSYCFTTPQQQLISPSSVAATTTLVVKVHYPHGNFFTFDQLRERAQGSAIPNLYIRGDHLGLNWNKGVLLTRNTTQSQDLWQISLSYDSSLSGQSFLFKILVSDTIWAIGANTQITIPAASSYADVYPWFVYQKGGYTYHRNIRSPQLNNSRDLVVYTPPSYYENTLKIIDRVLVMHDGQNLFNASTSFGGVAWGCDKTVDVVVVGGGMREIIIVGVDNTPDRTNELTYSYDPSEKAGGKGDLYLDFIQQTVMPYIQKKYRVSVGQQNMGIMGSSLGGLISCYAGWTRNNYWSTAGCMSSSFWWNTEDFNNIILVKNPAPTALKVYIDSGDAGPDNDDKTQTIAVEQHILKLGFTLNQSIWYYLDHGGQHNEYYWGQRFWIPMTELYTPSITATTPQ